MEFIIFGVICLIGILLISPLTYVSIKKTGTVLPPHKATMIGGILVGSVVNYSPIGKIVWSAMFHSNLGLSLLSSRALAACIVVIPFLVIALYIEFFYSQKD